MSTTVSFSSSRISFESSACQPPVLPCEPRSSAYFLIVEPFLSQSLVKIIDNVFVLVHMFAVSRCSHVRSRGMTRNRKRKYRSTRGRVTVHTYVQDVSMDCVAFNNVRKLCTHADMHESLLSSIAAGRGMPCCRCRPESTGETRCWRLVWV